MKLRNLLATGFACALGLAALQPAPAASAEKSGAPQDPAVPGFVPERIILTWGGDPARTQSATWRTPQRAAKPSGEIARLVSAPDFKAAAKVTAEVTSVELNPTRGIWQAASGTESTAPSSDQGGISQAEPEQSAFYYSVTFENLEPDTQYCYRVGDAETRTWSEWNVFRTASDKSAPFKFLYLGDAQNHIKSLWPRAVRTAFTRYPDIRCIVHAGDLIQDANNDSQWGDWVYSLGWISATVPSLPTPGNHEMADGKDADGKKTKTLSRFWRPQFALPLNGPADSKLLEETAYFIDLQGVRFVSVDSNFYKDAQQLQWLAGVLESNTNRWAIVIQHHPLYSTGRGRDASGVRNALRPIYEKHRVDLVLQGHDHTYGRTHKLLNDQVVDSSSPGVIYAVSVSGHKMYDLTETSRPLMAKMLANTQLYQIIEITGDRLTYTASSIDGVVVDKFQLIKSGNGNATYVNVHP
jgi:hypothetical protein